MLDEKSLRHPDFLEGIPIRLADGQPWTFPTPPACRDVTDGGEAPGAAATPFDPDHEALVTAILEAEDRAELLRAELALAIHLLARNYRLEPADFLTLLEFSPGDPALTAMQRSFHEVALEHIRSMQSADSARGTRDPKPHEPGVPCPTRPISSTPSRTPTPGPMGRRTLDREPRCK
jgi:hypothetical protein